jgi:hypothetical protein
VSAALRCSRRAWLPRFSERACSRTGRNRSSGATRPEPRARASGLTAEMREGMTPISVQLVERDGGEDGVSMPGRRTEGLGHCGGCHLCTDPKRNLSPTPLTLIGDVDGVVRQTARPVAGVADRPRRAPRRRQTPLLGGGRGSGPALGGVGGLGVVCGEYNREQHAIRSISEAGKTKPRDAGTRGWNNEEGRREGAPGSFSVVVAHRTRVVAG